MTDKIAGLDQNSFISRKPFLFTTLLLLVLFYLGHFSLSMSYKLGLEMSMVALVIYSLLTLIMLRWGFRTTNVVLKNVFGLCAGLCWWSVFGELGDTLQADFGVPTGVGIGYGNFLFLILLGIVLLMAVLRGAIKDDTILQFINFAFLNWFSHVILLTIYYAPVFGGATPELGTTVNCWDVWSTPRLVAIITVWVIYMFVMLPLVLFKFSKSPDIRIKVASAFWFLIFFWSAFVEIPKKLIYFILW